MAEWSVAIYQTSPLPTTTSRLPRRNSGSSVISLGVLDRPHVWWRKNSHCFTANTSGPVSYGERF